MSTIKTTLKNFAADESGQDMVEYALLLSFVALAAVGLLSGIKIQISGVWSSISKTLSSANTAAS